MRDVKRDGAPRWFVDFSGAPRQEAICAQKVIQDYAVKYPARDESS